MSFDRIEALGEVYSVRFSEVNSELLKLIGERIAEIGDLRPTELHRLEQMLRAGADIRKIERKLAELSSRTIADVQKVIESEALQGYELLQQSLKGAEAIPFEKNTHLQDTVDAVARQTAEQMQNLSQTTGFALKNPDGTMRYTPISNAYQDAIDDAIYAVQSGTIDYKTAMRDTIKQFADSGIRTIDYPSGYSRRIDAAIEQNIIDGVKQINQKVQDAVGERFGADGIELSVHNTCAPDHLPVQGRQFSKAEFAKMQSGESFVDYKGRKYDGFRRPIGQWNCRHIAFAIMLGVSVPNHTDEELEKIKRQNTERNITIDGKQYTGYEAMQLQRKLENATKHTRDRLNIATAAGDEQMINQERLRLKQLTQKYKEVSDKAGLPYRAERLKSAGYGATEQRMPDKVQLRIDVPSTPIKTTPTVNKAQAVQTVEVAKEGLTETIDKSKLLEEARNTLIGVTAKNGMVVQDVKEHFVDKLIEREFSLNDSVDALENYLHATGVKFTDRNEPSIQFIGEKATVVFNTDDGLVITGWATGKEKIRKYGGKT